MSDEQTAATSGPWIQTTSMVAFDLLAPTPDMVRVTDIAHALSRINRFSGHTHGEPYSVAHHSMLVADLLASWGAPVAIVREGLLHDAGEAYYGDLVSPLKRALTIQSDARDAGCTLTHVTRGIDRVVREALALPEHESPIVRRADLVALAIERRDLFGGGVEPRDWMLPEYAATNVACGRIHGHATWANTDLYQRLSDANLSPWNVARDRFLALLADLDAQIASAA